MDSIKVSKKWAISLLEDIELHFKNCEDMDYVYILEDIREYFFNKLNNNKEV